MNIAAMTEYTKPTKIREGAAVTRVVCTAPPPARGMQSAAMQKSYEAVMPTKPVPC